MPTEKAAMPEIRPVDGVREIPTDGVIALGDGKEKVVVVKKAPKGGRKEGGWFKSSNALYWLMILLAAILVVGTIVSGLCTTALVGKNTAAISKLQGRLGDLDSAVSSRFGELTVRVTDVEMNIADLQDGLGGLEQATATLTGRADSNDKKVSAISDELIELDGVAAKAAQAAAQANKRQDKRVKAENQAYRQKLAYIRGANPGFALCASSEAEVEKLLNDGVWNIEPLIDAEYQRLTAEATSAVDVKAEAAQNAAAQAQAAGDTALNGLDAIASQPNKPLGKSVSKRTKAQVKADIAEYWLKHSDAGPEIVAGAPEECPNP